MYGNLYGEGREARRGRGRLKGWPPLEVAWAGAGGAARETARMKTCAATRRIGVFP